MPDKEWDHKERRKDHMDFRTEMELIKQEISHIKTIFADSVKNFEKYFQKIDRLVQDVTELKGIDKKLDSHIITDRWVFGIIFTILGVFFALITFISKGGGA